MERRFIYGNCMSYLPDFPDNYFDVAVVDPPYFSGPEKRKFYGNETSPIGVKRVEYEKMDTWKPPSKEYFNQLFRISKNQIIWGCNYFDYNFPPGRIIWDKCNGNSSFSDCEIAACSFHDSVRLFRYMWNGMQQGKSINEGWIQQGNKSMNEKRIHQTQKPVNLYRWICQRYIKEGGQSWTPMWEVQAPLSLTRKMVYLMLDLKLIEKCMKLQPKDLKNFGHRLVFLILSAITEAKSASAHAFPGRG